MSKIISLYPTKITQPNSNERNPITKWNFKEVRRGGKTYPYGSANPNDPRYFHAWTNTSNLLSGGIAQCGRPSTYHCSHKTYYSIKGYRNTCPIAGCNGTYNAPATLRLHVNQKALINKGMTANSKIEKVVLIFQHACTGVDVANGKETTVWGPNFDGYATYPHLEGLKVFFTDTNGVHIQGVNNIQGNGFNYGNPPLSKKFGTVTVTFDGMEVEDLLNGAFNIVYGRNLSTNPGNIYLKKAIIMIQFSDAKEFITGKTSGKTLYTSSKEKCRTQLTHTITAGYKNGDKIIPDSQAPKKITKNDIIVSKPKKVNVTFDKQSGHNFIYHITDYSNKPGNKKIKYRLKGSDKSVIIEYTAKTRNKPTIKVPNKILYDLNDSDALTTLIAKDGCLYQLDIYLDSITNRIAHLTSFTNDSNNWIKPSDIIHFGQTISKQSCGAHTLYFKRNNESNKDMIAISYTIIPRTYMFTFTCPPEYEEDTRTFEFKKNGKRIINITRIDEQQPKTTPNFLITENTLDGYYNLNMKESIITPIEIGETKEIDITTYTPGEFYISIQEHNNQCTVIEDKRNIIVIPDHKQYHDIVYVRGEDSTSFDYKYIAIWEGDEVRRPIDVADINAITRNEDIHICTENKFSTGLSQTGLAQIIVKNDSQLKMDLYNIDIELNVSNSSYDVSTDEFFEEDGMLLDLYNNFSIYNPYILDNVSLKHLTEDEDMVEEENVYLHIDELPYQESITINIPFQCNTAKDIYLQCLIFGEILPLYQKNNCRMLLPNDYIILSTFDSIMTQLKIDGVTDLYCPNIWYDLESGEKLGTSTCPNECFNTKKEQNKEWYNPDPEDKYINGGIRYSITNIDTNTIHDAQVVIHNDKAVIPFGWIYEDQYQFIGDNSNDTSQPVQIIYEEQESFDHPIVNALIGLTTHFPQSKENTIKQRTNHNGETTFFIDIPEYLDSPYTIQQLINDKIIGIKYDGNSQTNGCQIGYINNEVTQEDNNIKNPSYMYYIDTHKRYYPGQVLELRIQLNKSTMSPINDIILNIDTFNPNDEKELIVFYKICNLENNQGIFNTKLQTDDIKLIPNEVSHPIYCGINTDLKTRVQIKKKVIEQYTLNTIYIDIFNANRDNSNIACDIVLDKNPEEMAYYSITEVNIDDGTYNINDNILHWYIGEMKANTSIHAKIYIKGEEIGLSNIKVSIYDFLQNLEIEPCIKEMLQNTKYANCKYVHELMGHYLCPPCSEQ